MTEILFCSERGRLYTPAQVRPVVLALLRARWGSLLQPGWIDAADRVGLRNAAWLRLHNGETPGSLARQLETAAITLVVPPTEAP